MHEMTEWIDWMHENEWMHAWMQCMNEYMYECVHKWMNEWNECMKCMNWNECMNEMNEWMKSKNVWKTLNDMKLVEPDSINRSVAPLVATSENSIFVFST